MTFFLSGLYLLPESKKRLYDPPNNPRGASDIGYLTDEHIKSTLTNVRRAWLEGHEIGTHFNGHFCGGHGTVANWTPKQWRSEIDQAKAFVKQWKTNTGWRDLPALPFDYDKELVGGRTPCLLGQNQLLPTARELGWRYDASSPGGLQVWPRKKLGIWDLPLQQIPFPGRKFEVLSMDYNMMYNQSQNSTKAPAGNYPGWRQQAAGAYIAGFKRAYETNRAPLFIGNHFEHWNGGIYMDASRRPSSTSRARRRRAPTCASSPSGSTWTGWTRRSRRCSPSCAASAWARRRPAAGSSSCRAPAARGPARAREREPARVRRTRPEMRFSCRKGGAQDPRNGHAKLFT